MATPSAFDGHRDWIESQLTLGRNATSIYQDLEEKFGFTHRYNSVKRFVAALKAREPERFDVLEALPGAEAQVDFCLGAPTRMLNGKYRRPHLFVMTLIARLAAVSNSSATLRVTIGPSKLYIVKIRVKSGISKEQAYRKAQHRQFRNWRQIE